MRIGSECGRGGGGEGQTRCERRRKQLMRTEFFFFSSRRRHTRCSRDWSSDVCSSDLRLGRYTLSGDDIMNQWLDSQCAPSGLGKLPLALVAVILKRNTGQAEFVDLHRSEERRVGKEGRSRWSPYH